MKKRIISIVLVALICSVLFIPFTASAYDGTISNETDLINAFANGGTYTLDSSNITVNTQLVLESGKSLTIYPVREDFSSICFGNNFFGDIVVVNSGASLTLSGDSRGGRLLLCGNFNNYTHWNKNNFSSNDINFYSLIRNEGTLNILSGASLEYFACGVLNKGTLNITGPNSDESFESAPPALISTDCGIYNYGGNVCLDNACLFGTNIYAFDSGILNVYGDVTIKSAYIRNFTYGICNYDYVLMEDGEISESEIGVANGKGTFKMYGGDILGNTTYDVYNNGTFKHGRGTIGSIHNNEGAVYNNSFFIKLIAFFYHLFIA